MPGGGGPGVVAQWVMLCLATAASHVSARVPGLAAVLPIQPPEAPGKAAADASPRSLLLM